jgi:hypothetical protein
MADANNGTTDANADTKNASADAKVELLKHNCKQKQSLHHQNQPQNKLVKFLQVSGPSLPRSRKQEREQQEFMLLTNRQC